MGVHTHTHNLLCSYFLLATKFASFVYYIMGFIMTVYIICVWYTNICIYCIFLISYPYCHSLSLFVPFLLTESPFSFHATHTHTHTKRKKSRFQLIEKMAFCLSFSHCPLLFKIFLDFFLALHSPSSTHATYMCIYM